MQESQGSHINSKWKDLNVYEVSEASDPGFPMLLLQSLAPTPCFGGIFATQTSLFEVLKAGNPRPEFP